MFGAPSNTSGAFGSGGIFGQQQQQQPQQAATAFGQQQQQPANTGFGGFGQQQQQQPSAFGQAPAASAFGGAGAFGASTSGASTFGAPSGAFGQQQQQQQPASNPFGATQQAGTSAFGAFGAAPSTGAFGSATNNNAFGAQRPGFGSTGSFGSTNPTFGASTSTFGQQPTQSAFGAAAATPVPATGTANPPFSVVSHADNDATPNVKSSFMSISCMEPYKNASFEELRVADYQQNRKSSTTAGTGAAFGTNATGAFGGGASAFGGGTGSFGQGTGTFGQQQQASTGAFGQQPSASTAFGQPTGGFGQQQPAGAFGSTSTGGFGQSAPAVGAFGQPAAGGFGQNQATSTGAFGSANNAFAPKPSPFGSTTGTGFGTTTPANTGFGTGTTGAFGTTPTNTNAFGATSQPAASGGLFGNQTASTGGFGAGNSAFGAKPNPFGATTNTFGQAAAAAPAANPFGAFGQQQQQQPTTANPLGGATGGLFGQQQQQGQQQLPGQQAAPTGGLFGNGATPAFGTGSTFGASGGFGASNGGLFGAKPAGSGFGQSQPGAGGLFGNAVAQQPGAGGFGSSTFGQTHQPAAGLGGFGSGSLFGNASGQQAQLQGHAPQQATLQASVDQNAYGNNPIFANLGSLTPSAALAATTKKKAPPISDVRAAASPRPTGASSKINKLRGFSTGSGSLSSSPLKASSLSLSTSHGFLDTGKNSVFTTFGTATEDSVLSPNAFVSRPSAKKLLIRPGAAKEASLRQRSTTAASVSPPPKSHAAKSGQLVFDPDAETLANDTFVGRGLSGAITSTPARPATKERERATSTTPPRVPTLPSSYTRSEAKVLLTESTAQEGDYWMAPSLDILQKMSRDQLKHVRDFTVGRKGYGKVRFQTPVDLSTVTSFKAILDDYIIFEPQQCTVYPDDMESEKPATGEGLNVPGVITLEGCYPLSKDTRSPVKDGNDVRVKQYVNKLKRIPGTTFIDYDATTSQWTFRVEQW